MHKIIAVKPLEGYKVWLRFHDNVEGVADLSHLVGIGIFSVWEDKEFFNSVFVDKESHTIAWSGGIDLCPDTLYAAVLGVEPSTILKTEKTAS